MTRETVRYGVVEGLNSVETFETLRFRLSRMLTDLEERAVREGIDVDVSSIQIFTEEETYDSRSLVGPGESFTWNKVVMKVTGRRNVE